MHRAALGIAMLDWHNGQSDPVYMVGSLYLDNRVYPDKEIFDSALTSLESNLSQHRRMLAKDPVIVTRFGQQVDLRKFAGYTDDMLETQIGELEEIVEALREFKTEDYGADTIPDPAIEAAANLTRDGLLEAAANGAALSEGS